MDKSTWNLLFETQCSTAAVLTLHYNTLTNTQVNNRSTLLRHTNSGMIFHGNITIVPPTSILHSDTWLLKLEVFAKLPMNDKLQ